MPASAEIRTLICAAILHLLGCLIIHVSLRKVGGTPAERRGPWLVLLSSPLMAFLIWALQFLLIDWGRYPHAFSDALGLLPAVVFIGSLVGVPIACFSGFTVRRRIQLENRDSSVE